MPLLSVSVAVSRGVQNFVMCIYFQTNNGTQKGFHTRQLCSQPEEDQKASKEEGWPPWVSPEKEESAPRQAPRELQRGGHTRGGPLGEGGELQHRRSCSACQ
jgi:hypothetical protein